MLPRMAPPETIADIAATLRVEDLLVFALREDGASLLGGSGRGAGWAGLVELSAAGEPPLAELLERRRVQRVDHDAPVHIVGPYWAAHAALVPVGEHMIVVGATERIRASSGELVRHATEAVALIGDVPSSKLLADELELVQAVQQLNEFTPRSLAEAATHAAAVAADALSCEIGVVLLHRDGMAHVHGAGSAWSAMADDPVLSDALMGLAARTADGPIVEQDLDAVGESGLRIVSCYALGIGPDGTLGALIVGHTDARPRGFTTLCRRVGRALADAAESSLMMAIAHEELAAQRDRYAREARVDRLTGLGNLVQWEDELAAEEARWQRHGRPIVLVAMDVNDLKEANDRHGHAAGDELLRTVAGILRGAMRASDVLARTGGDEFAAMLLEADATGAASLKQRVEVACAAAGTDPPVSLSIGWAVPEAGETLRAAFARADAAMYEAKRALVPSEG
jgi:diguanylate cyclase (GGDEF)-like protein